MLYCDPAVIKVIAFIIAVIILLLLGTISSLAHDKRYLRTRNKVLEQRCNNVLEQSWKDKIKRNHNG